MLDRISFEAFYRIFFFYCFFDELYALFVCFVSVYSLLLFSCFSQVNFLYDSSSDNWDWISLLFRVLLLFFWGGAVHSLLLCFYRFACFLGFIFSVWRLGEHYSSGWVELTSMVVSYFCLIFNESLDNSRFYEIVKSADQFLSLINI